MATTYKYRYNTGTHVPNWNEWTPDVSTVCDGTVFQQYKTDRDGICPTQSKQLTGTHVPNWNEWTPDVSGVCLGTVFQQSKDDLSGICATQYKYATGIKQPTWSAWEPDILTVCSGTVFQQYRANECSGLEEYRDRTGTMELTWRPENYPYSDEGGWGPRADTMCADKPFTQFRESLQPCPGIQQVRQVTGTRQDCNFPLTDYWAIPDGDIHLTHDYVFSITQERYEEIINKFQNGGAVMFQSIEGYQQLLDNQDVRYTYGGSRTEVSEPQPPWRGCRPCSINEWSWTAYDGNTPPSVLRHIRVYSIRPQQSQPDIYEQDGHSVDLRIKFQYQNGQMLMGVSIPSLGPELTSDPDVVDSGIGGSGSATVFGFNIPMKSNWYPGWSVSAGPHRVFNNTVKYTLVVE